MKTLIDLTGKKVGRLTVIGRDPNSEPDAYSRPQVYWICKCECGNTKSIRGCNLRGGKSSKTKSCGCLQKEKAAENGRLEKQPPLIIPQRNLYCAYRNRATRILKVPFEISFEDFVEMCKKKCIYCDAPPSNKVKNRKDESDFFIYNGIDRIDSKKGYVQGNMVPCCKICNKAKLDLTTDEFFSWIKRLSKNIDTLLNTPGIHYLFFAD